MKLFYYHSPNNNFGDAINPWFWKNLLKPEMTDWIGDGSDNVNTELLVGVGTLINNRIPEVRHVHIFGTGAGYGEFIPLAKAKENWQIHCVRGPLTAKALGIDISLAIADPIILLNKLVTIETNKTIKCSFMPHIGIDSKRFQNICEEVGITYISPSWERDKIIQIVNQSEKLICSAMHGAILAESLRVPWHPIITSKEILDFKWKDWCYSLELEYTPSKIDTVWSNIDSNFLSQLKGTIKKHLVQKSLTRISEKGAFILSKENVFRTKISQLENAIDRFNEQV